MHTEDIMNKNPSQYPTIPSGDPTWPGESQDIQSSEDLIGLLKPTLTDAGAVITHNGDHIFHAEFKGGHTAVVVFIRKDELHRGPRT